MKHLSIRGLFFAFSGIIALLLLALSLWLYDYVQSMTRMQNDHFSHDQAHIIRYTMMQYYDQMAYRYTATERSQADKMALARDYFQRHGMNAPLEALQKLLEDPDSRYNVYLINRDFVVEYTTFPNDLGLDFKLYPDVPKLFEEQFENPSHFDISPPFHEASEGGFKRYMTQRSMDGKYIIQLSQSLKGNDSLNTLMLDLKAQIPALDSHAVYTVYTTDNEPTAIKEIWSKQFVGMRKNEIVKRWDRKEGFKSIMRRLAPQTLPLFDNPKSGLYPYLETLFRDNRLLETRFEKEGRYLHLMMLPYKSYYHQAESSFSFAVLTFDETEAYREVLWIQRAIFSVWGILLLLAAAMGVAFYRRVIFPIDKLQSQMHQKRPVTDSAILAQHDEVSVMAKTYNWLLLDLQNEIKTNTELLERFKIFTANAIHQIRTPLSVIKIALESLRDPNGEAILHIRSSLVSMEHLYDTLAFSLQNETTEFTTQEVELSSLLRERIELFSPVAASLDTVIEAEIADVGTVMMNRTELEYLIDNNLSNALKYGEPRKPVIVTLRTSPNEYILSFESYGKPVQQSKQLFERYVRFDKTQKGFGIGLNIVAAISRRHHIVIQLTYEEGRNCFRYFIPITDSHYRQM